MPASLGQLPRLRVLNLAYNRIENVPDKVLTPPELRMIDLTGNPMFAERIAHLRALRPKVDIQF